MTNDDLLLRCADEGRRAELWREACALTKCVAQGFDSCCIVNARSGGCSENCKWCAQARGSQATFERYPLLTTADILPLAQKRAQEGVGRFSIVTSGRALSEADVDHICETLNELREHVNIHRCLSAGLCNEQQLRKLKDAGLERYHCNLEAAPSFFDQVCTSHTQRDKLATLDAARNVGLELCCGFIFGMGESWRQRIELCQFIAERVKPASIPINALVPIPGTPLQGRTPPTLSDLRTMVAVARLTNPQAEVRLAGGRLHYPPDALLDCLRSGANGAIVGDLLTTAGPQSVDDDLQLAEQWANDNSERGTLNSKP